ncbi:hypothetical protein [Natronosalvus rutilus]|uniref:Uncharacterized protein n=1 Tax=Natronosalvus rutilus TaxID=2953753 RepID=A0A9E7NEK9_9EURY|nr:hypothetical protein [Natronosalvus rutilus]UTF56041.1 hypothetical protein NGM29_20860 [Natronosalvus rutilus]
MPDLNSGVIGIPEDEWCEFGEPTTAGYTRMEGEFELATVIQATDTHRDLEGEYIATSGKAAREEAIEVDKTRVDGENNEIGTVSARRKEAHQTNWICVPNRYVVAERSVGEFVFYLIAEQGTARITRAEVDLISLRDAYPDASEWALGPEGFVRGTLYGNSDVLNDTLGDSASNQLGLEGNFEGYITKMMVTRSGYVAAWDLDTEKFAKFVNEVILPHTEVPEEEDEEEREEDQSGLDSFGGEPADD